MTACGTWHIVHPGEPQHEDVLSGILLLSSKCPRSIPTTLDHLGNDAQIFLRAGQMAELDRIRTELLNRSAITLQRHARGFVQRSQYQRKRHAAIALQVRPCIPTLPPLTRGLSYFTHQLGGCVAQVPMLRNDWTGLVHSC